MSRWLVAIAIMLGAAMPVPVLAEELLIIANPSVEVAGPVSLDQVAAIYLLRTATWADGSRIIPVNREAGSVARATFTSQVLRQDDATLAAYWNQMHFMGMLPPVTQESDQSMLAFIQRVPGSIGYIDAGIPPAGVKVLAHVP